MIKTAPIIRSSNSWKELFEKCERLSNKEKGDVIQLRQSGSFVGPNFGTITLVPALDEAALLEGDAQPLGGGARSAPSEAFRT